MSSIRHTYYAFLLRLRRENELSPWRASLQDPRTRQQFNFGSVGDLLAFLEDCTGERWQKPPPEEGAEQPASPNVE